MAKNTITTTTITDDIDGTEGATEYSFSVQGTQYSIDLSEKNAAKFNKAMAPFIEKATKVGGTRKKATTGGKRTDLSDARAWLKAEGYEVSTRGRISAELLALYDAK